MRDDVYYRTEKYEYRIETQPIKVSARLIKRYDEPPLEYKVKDGVVLESDILTQSKFLGARLVKDLKEQVEWQEYPLTLSSVIPGFLISRHPELVSKEDFKRHIDKIPKGLSLVLRKSKNTLPKITTKI